MSIYASSVLDTSDIGLIGFVIAGLCLNQIKLLVRKAMVSGVSAKLKDVPRLKKLDSYLFSSVTLALSKSH